jgi:hypothetical protein
MAVKRRGEIRYRRRCPCRRRVLSLQWGIDTPLTDTDVNTDQHRL